MNPYAPYTTPPPPSGFRHSRPPHMAAPSQHTGAWRNDWAQGAPGPAGQAGYGGPASGLGPGQGQRAQRFVGQGAFETGGASAAFARPIPELPPEHLGARDRAARRFAIRPSSTGEAPVGEIGRVIYAIVQEQPGIHFRGLARAANLTSAGQLRHHLDRLERHGLVVELEDGRYKRFFAAGDHEPELRPGLARFSRLVPRRIGKLLLAGPMNRTELRRSLGCADSTLGYHLNRMLRSGDLQKQRTPTGCNYALTDESFVRRLLQQPDGRPAPGPNGTANGAANTPNGTAIGAPDTWTDPQAIPGRDTAMPPPEPPGPAAPSPGPAPGGGLGGVPGPA